MVKIGAELPKLSQK